MTVEAGIAVAIDKRCEQEDASHRPPLSDRGIAGEQEPI
jgi:hypothetical protein